MINDTLNINILIATCDRGILKTSNVLLPYRSDIKYIISHQITKNEFDTLPYELQRNDVIVYKMYTKGLSKNRNLLIEKADADICIIADDDVTYTFEYIDAIKYEFSHNNDLALLTGKINTREKEKPYKKYSDSEYYVSWKNFTKISSIEISFRRKLIQGNIYFDINFGLGSSKYSLGGEESIFISDCLKNQLKIKYIPQFVVNHPYESSRNFINGNQLAQYHKALAKRIFGNYSKIVLIYLYIKNKNKYNMTFLKFIFSNN